MLLPMFTTHVAYDVHYIRPKMFTKHTNKHYDYISY